MEPIILRQQNPKIKVGTTDFDEMDVLNDTYKHRADVVMLGCRFQELMTAQFANHDQSKVENLGLFTRALYTDFKKDQYKNIDWMKLHTDSERHHLRDKVPSDVTLVDILEYMIDCICAGRTRGDGEFHHPKINVDVLLTAFDNTVFLLNNSIEDVPFDHEQEP